MRFVTCSLAVTAALFAMPTLANPKLCKELSEKWRLKGRAAGECFCGPELSNLQVSLPVGMKVVATCALQQGARRIDPAKEKLSLDEYDAKGNYVTGTIFISGQAVISGVVRVAPGYAGDLWFDANPKITSRKSVFTEHYLNGGLKLYSDEHYRKFRAPKPKYVPNASPECWSATATIKARDFRVEISGTDSQGTYADHVEVLRVTKFNKVRCE